MLVNSHVINRIMCSMAGDIKKICSDIFRNQFTLYYPFFMQSDI